MQWLELAGAVDRHHGLGRPVGEKSLEQSPRTGSRPRSITGEYDHRLSRSRQRVSQAGNQCGGGPGARGLLPHELDRPDGRPRRTDQNDLELRGHRRQGQVEQPLPVNQFGQLVRREPPGLTARQDHGHDHVISR